MLAGRIPSRCRIELIDVPEPRLERRAPGEPGRILFEPALGCLCGSDLPFFDGTHGRESVQIGHSLHEMIGRVVETTGDRYRPGDRILAVPVDQVGLFERWIVDEERTLPLDDRVPPEQALLAQPLGTVIYALKKLPTVLDQDVVVVGQGPIGQMFIAALRNLGARRIVAVEKRPSRLATSARMGATATVCNAETDPVAAVRELTGGAMADVVIEAVGHDDQALDLCGDLCRHGGRILYFGVPPRTIDGVRWADLFFKNLTIHTTVNPDFRRDFPLAMQWIGERRLDLSPLLTHRYPLAEIQTAFETFHQRRDGALKVLVDFPRST